MTSEIKPTGFFLKLGFILTGQVHKIIFDYDSSKPRINFSRKTKDDFK